MQRYCLSLFASSVIALSGCSQSVKVTPSKEFSGNLKVLALLPQEYPSGISPERISGIRSALSSELKGSGFVLLDDRVVQAACSSPNCPERSKLKDERQADGFVTLKIKTVTKSNFLAGYYHSISGELTISDVNQQDLLSVSTTESERGGLVFNSGQVFQGLISQIKSARAESDTDLAASFAKTLVSKIPLTKSDQLTTSAAYDLSIETIEPKQVSPRVYQTCAKGSPGSLAYLIYNQRRANLREVSPGLYCGTYFFGDQISSATVELRSAYGGAVRKEFSLGTSTLCPLEGFIKVQEQKGVYRLAVTCTAFLPNMDVAEECEQVQVCQPGRLVIYRGASVLGPFEKVAEVSSANWTDSKVSNRSTPVYQIVYVGRDGSRSPPVTALTPGGGNV